MKTVIAVNPFDCRMWDLHDRLETQVTEESCKAEIESFSKHGQLIPVLGRPLTRDPTHKVELICGARRLFVARHINAPLLVDLREMTDREAIVAMDIENRQRADISAYERGLSYARWLRSGQFQSQDDLARQLRISASQVSRLLRLAQLPPVIVNSFEGPNVICEGWGLEIVQALEDPHRRQATVRAARAIASMNPRPTSREVYRQLISASASGRRMKKPAHDEVVKDAGGKPLFRIRHQSGSIAFIFPLDKLSAPTLLGTLRETMARVLKEETATATAAAAAAATSAAPARAVRDAKTFQSQSGCAAA